FCSYFFCYALVLHSFPTRRSSDLFVGYRREWVEQGALFSYAHDLASVGPRAAQYIDRILKGAKPAELPFQEASHFDFVINLKTADRKSTRLTPVTVASRMPSSACK